MTAFFDTARTLAQEVRLHELDFSHFSGGLMATSLSTEVFLAIWDPRLFALMDAWSNIVDHPCDLLSAVIVGRVTDVVYSVFNLDPSDDVVSRAFSKLAKVDRIGCVSSEDGAQLPDLWVAREAEFRPRPAGSEYSVPRRFFHATRVTELSVLICHRSNCDTRPGRVLGSEAWVELVSPEIETAVLQEAAAKLRELP